MSEGTPEGNFFAPISLWSFALLDSRDFPTDVWLWAT